MRSRAVLLNSHYAVNWGQQVPHAFWLFLNFSRSYTHSWPSISPEHSSDKPKREQSPHFGLTESHFWTLATDSTGPYNLAPPTNRASLVPALSSSVSEDASTSQGQICRAQSSSSAAVLCCGRRAMIACCISVGDFLRSFNRIAERACLGKLAQSGNHF